MKKKAKPLSTWKYAEMNSRTQSRGITETWNLFLTFESMNEIVGNNYSNKTSSVVFPRGLYVCYCYCRPKLFGFRFIICLSQCENLVVVKTRQHCKRPQSGFLKWNFSVDKRKKERERIINDYSRNSVICRSQLCVVKTLNAPLLTQQLQTLC